MTRPPHVSGPYLDNANEWRWSIIAGNGETIAVSSEGYQNHVDCERGKELARQALNLEHAPMAGLLGLGWTEQKPTIQTNDRKPSGMGALGNSLRKFGS